LGRPGGLKSTRKLGALPVEIFKCRRFKHAPSLKHA
jgi:hypothetical protein